MAPTLRSGPRGPQTLTIKLSSLKLKDASLKTPQQHENSKFLKAVDSEIRAQGIEELLARFVLPALGSPAAFVRDPFALLEQRHNGDVTVEGLGWLLCC